MMKRKKRWIVIPLLVLVVAGAVGIGIKTDVFGRFTPKEPYVTGDPESMNELVVTSEGGNRQGEMGSGAEPCSPEVPTAEGKKGSETNPFVILEIVANHCDQQMPYLAAEDDSQEPLDIMKIGIDVAKKQDKSYVPGRSSSMDNDKLSSMGQWFSNYKFAVNRIGSTPYDIKTDEMTFVDIDKLYTLEITTDDLKEADLDAEQFKKDFNNTYQKYATPVWRTKSLSESYKDVFQKDKKGKQIREEALDDEVNWWAEYEHKTVKEAVSETYQGKGYLLAVEPGQGDFGFASEEDCQNWVFTKTGTDADRWKYVENLSDLPEEYVNLYQKDDARLLQYGFYYKSKGIWWTDPKDLYNKYLEDDAITGLYMDLAETSNVTCRYDIESAEYKDVYTFTYYGIRNNNIVKRQLFTFATQKEYDDFHMKVITMTPAELNALGEKDSDDTLDLIERADLFYIGSYVYEKNEAEKINSITANIDKVHDLYYGYTEDGKNQKADKNKLKSFEEDDLDWNLCYKMIYRLCNNKNLPLMLTQGLGYIVDRGTASIPMYESEQYPKEMRNATLCNLAKLYIIGTQFDLTAKMAEDEKYVWTFYDDILSTGKLLTIGLSPTAISDADLLSKNPAKTTGYYERPKLAVGADPGEGEKCYYMWNMLTFLPTDLEYIFYNQDQISTDDNVKKDFEAHGFMPSFLSSQGSTPGRIMKGGEATHQDGSDGSVGNVAIPHNNGDPQYSTLLGVTEGGSFENAGMNAAFQILNNRSEVVNPQIVKVMKQKKEYVKMADTAVLLDYSTEDSFGDKKSYIKVQIHANNNDQAGLVTKVTLKNASGQKAPVDSTLKLYKSKQCVSDASQPECDKENYGSYSGYNIPATDTLVAYVPYSLEQWADGYNIIEFETIGRIYSQKKKTVIAGSAVKTEINISERTLFNLE